MLVIFDHTQVTPTLTLQNELSVVQTNQEREVPIQNLTPSPSIQKTGNPEETGE